MKTKMKMLIAALSVAFLTVFSFNVFSQGNKPQQDDKGKKSGCMAMMESKEMEGCMSMMDSKKMQAMCAKMMSSMKGGEMKMDGDMKMDGNMKMNMKMDMNKMKSGEPKSQKL